MSNPEIQEHPQVLVVGPDGIARSGDPQDESGERPVTEMVEQPAKVMRIGSMIRQLLEEVRAAPLDEKSRARLKAIHESSIKELESGLAPELVSELERLSLPFTEEELPSEAELRVAQAQLVGWLEGLFHGIQTTLFAQQMAARAQLEQMRRALPPGMMPVPPGGDQEPHGRLEGAGKHAGSVDGGDQQQDDAAAEEHDLPDRNILDEDLRHGVVDGKEEKAGETEGDPVKAGASRIARTGLQCRHRKKAPHSVENGAILFARFSTCRYSAASVSPAGTASSVSPIPPLTSMKLRRRPSSEVRRRRA